MSRFEADWQFTSLVECVRDIGKRFPPDETTIVELRTPSGLIAPHRAPKYLYRGECGLFATTESSLTRLERSGLFDAAQQQILRKIYEKLQWRFRQEDYGNSEWNADGLLQHYGVPTEVIDFSSSLETAAAFAASTLPGRGRICVLTKAIGFEAKTIEYTQHEWAERARRQKAFGIRLLQLSDLKTDEARTKLGAVWAEFPLKPEDLEGRRGFFDSLVDESNDPHSGMVRAEINHYVERFGKIPHKVAQYLTDHVPMVPRLLKVAGFDDSTGKLETNHVAPSARRYCPNLERQKSLRYWSEQYTGETDSLSQFYPFENPREIGTEFAWPGTHHEPSTDDSCDRSR